jgi:hypothetical protein
MALAVGNFVVGQYSWSMKNLQKILPTRSIFYCSHHRYYYHRFPAIQCLIENQATGPFDEDVSSILHFSAEV